MQSELIQELLNIMNTKLLGLLLQLLLLGAILMYIKDISSKMLDYIKVKFSDFGRGTKIEINGRVGYIMGIGFNEVEIEIDEHTTMIIPVSNFVNSNKIIIRNNRG